MREIGWFCNLEALARDPDALARLRDAVGLTFVIPESHVYHTSGFRISEELAEASPFRDWRERPEVAAHLRSHGVEGGAYPVLPGILGGADDRDLLTVLARAERAGVAVWGHIGLWSYAGELYPEMAIQAAVGNVMDERYRRSGVGFCPNRRELNDWINATAREAARNYPVAGFCVDHARFPAPANLPSLTACVCAHCEAEAARLGYNLPGLAAAVRRFWEQLPNLSAAACSLLGSGSATPLEWLDLLGIGAGFMAFVEFRCRTISDRFGEFRAALKEERGAEFPVGADTFPPSVAILAGHDYSQWQDVSDFLTGGHGAVVAWDNVARDFIASLAARLHENNPDLTPEVMRPVLERLCGMAGTLDDPEATLAREWKRLAAKRRGRTPAYPALRADGSPEQLRARCEALAATNVEGAVLSNIPDDPASLQVLREFAEGSA